MTEMGKRAISGRCLCGAVTFSASVVIDAEGHIPVGACHCSMCRRWSGGVLLALDEASDLVIVGEDDLAIYKSSDWAERCFCRVCGSNMLWRSPLLGVTVLMAGALDDQDDLILTKQIFIDAKPAYVSFAETTKCYTGAEFIKLMMQGGPGT